MPVIIGVNFHSMVRTRPLLRHGRVQTLVDPLTRPKFGNKEISNRCFCYVSWHVGYCIPFQPIKLQSDLFSGPYSGFTLHVVYFYLLIEVRSLKSKIAMTSCSRWASSTNLHSLQTGYWSPVTITVSAHWQRYHLRHKTHCYQLRLHSTSWCLST